MEKKFFQVNMTVQLDHSVVVEAESKEEAEEIVKHELDQYPYDAKDWSDGGVEVWSVDETDAPDGL